MFVKTYSNSKVGGWNNGKMVLDGTGANGSLRILRFSGITQSRTIFTAYSMDTSSVFANDNDSTRILHTIPVISTSNEPSHSDLIGASGDTVGSLLFNTWDNKLYYRANVGWWRV